MSIEVSAVKSLAKRHHLVLTKDVPIDESTINMESILCHSGGVDAYLAHGAVGHTDVSIAVRTLILRENAKDKHTKVSLFAIAVPQDNSGYMLIASPQTLPPELLKLISHSKGAEHKNLSDNQHHQVYLSHMPQPDEQAYARELGARLPQALNLEKTSRQLVLFTAQMPDANQAEHLLRLAIELS